MPQFVMETIFDTLFKVTINSIVFGKILDSCRWYIKFY